MTGVAIVHSHQFEAVLQLADDHLILGQRVSEWCGHAPMLEEDLALPNIALDLIGQARSLYTYAGEVEGRGREEDDLAMFRSEREFTNLLLVEQLNGDFAHTMARQLLFDAYQLLLWDDLSHSDDVRLAGIAAKALKEARYHFRFSSGWMIRLGDGTEESHRRAQTGVEHLWRFTSEMFEGATAGYRESWAQTVTGVLEEATLTMPTDPYQRSGGRSGFHTEHLGSLLAEMQWMQRSYPGMEW